MNLDEARSLLHIGETKLRGLIADGTIRVEYRGRFANVNENDVAAYVATHECKPKQPELPPSEQLLAEYYALGGFERVGCQYGVSAHVIRRKIVHLVPAEHRELNIRAGGNNQKRVSRSNLPDADTLLGEYYELGSYDKVARKYGVTSRPIRKRICHLVSPKRAQATIIDNRRQIVADAVRRVKARRQYPEWLADLLE